jgi:uncharacterized iron-regulated membrane protein
VTTLHPVLLFLHRWSGILAAALLIVAGLTGSALVFRADLDRRLNPELLRVQPKGQPLDVDTLVQRIEQRHQVPVNAITPAEDPSGAWVLSLARREQVFVDPYSGEPTGMRVRGEGGLGRTQVMRTLFEIHHDLMLGQPGHWVLGIASLVWILLSLVGVYLALKQAGGFKAAFRIRTASMRRLLLDLHRSLGLASVLAVVVVAFSGIYLNLRQEVGALVQIFSPVTPPPDRTLPAESLRGGAGIGYRAAMEAALTATPGARVQSVSANRAKGFYRVRLVQPGDLNARGDGFVYVSMHDARILQRRDVKAGTAGDVFLGWQAPLHSGEAFGLPGRLLVFVIGLLPLGFALSGVWLWLGRRRRAPRSELPLQPAVE